MILKWSCAVLLIAAGVATASSSVRIVGGQTTNVELFPYIVQVESRGVLSWSQSCAGSILTTRFVLSAAQCFSGSSFSLNRRRIRAGVTLRGGRAGTVIGIQRTLNHPRFNPITLEGDICIVELSSALNYGAQIQAGTIISQEFELPDNLPVFELGWGSTNMGGSGTSNTLRKNTVFTVNNSYCARSYAEMFSQRVVSDTMICTGVLGQDGHGSCNGDEGGPVEYDGIIVGIISWRHRCGNGTVPAVNTRVATYTNWIVINAR